MRTRSEKQKYAAKVVAVGAIPVTSAPAGIGWSQFFFLGHFLEISSKVEHVPGPLHHLGAATVVKLAVPDNDGPKRLFCVLAFATTSFFDTTV